MSKFNLLSVSSDAKTIKGEKLGYLTGILYLAPADVSGYQVCPYSTPGCRESCLFTAGHGSLGTVQRARIRKTRLFKEDQAKFLSLLEEDFVKLKSIAKKRKMIPCVRLNGTSDIMWEKYLNLTKYSMQFYDYTKNHTRINAYLNGYLPINYHLTFSSSEMGDPGPRIGDKLGHGIAVVFNVKKGRPLPKTYYGYPVIDGDISDLRFLDPKGGIVIGLRAKGKARKDTTGFVVKI